MSIHPKAALTRTSSDGGFSAGCVLVPFFSLFICHSVISHLISLSGWLGWLGRLGYPRYVYGAHMFVIDSDDDQATTLCKSVLQNIARSASQCIICVTNK